jgi:hypothetical protein
MESDDLQNNQRDPPSNVLVIALLAVVAGPTYILYRTMNDQALLDRFLSHYTEIPSPDTNCIIREIRQRGGPDNYGLATGFAYYGNDRWQIGVVLNREPSHDEIISYCATLNLLVDFMRDPDARSPNFPNSNTPVVQPYPPQGAPPPREDYGGIR